MDFATVLTAILVVTLIYVHIKQSDLIFQRDVKIAKILTIILLCVFALRSTPLSAPIHYFQKGSIRYAVSLHSIILWTLAILTFWKLLSGFYKDAFFKRIGRPDQPLREKIKDIILDVIEQNQRISAFKIFLKTGFDDPTIETVRRECKSIGYAAVTGPEHYTQEQLDKLKALAEKLG